MVGGVLGGMIGGIFSFWLFIFSVFSPPVFAEVYRCVQEPGVVTLSNVEKGKNCEKMILPAPESRALDKKAGSKSPNSGLAGGSSDKAGKNKSSYEETAAERKRIIEEEIDLEKGRLDTVNSRMKVLNGISKKSAQQSAELTALQKKQNLHQGNLALLQKELAKP